MSSLESDVERLVERGRMVPLAGEGTLAMGPAAAHSRPAFYDQEERIPNVDNVLLAPATVAGAPAVVAAIAHGNYKDNACAFASAAAMVAAEAELARDFLGEADVGPALQRAFHEADARIREVASGPLPRDPRLFATTVGQRRSLEAIGASMLAAVVTENHVFVAHAGECRAFLVAPGAPRKDVVQPHVFSVTPEARARLAEDPSQRFHFESVVTRLVGFGRLQIDLTRAPLPPGARLVLGNPALANVADFDGAAADVVARLAAALSAPKTPTYWLPVSLAIVDDVRGLSSRAQ